MPKPRSLSRRSGPPDDRGAAAVEFALVSIVLFPLLFGTIGFGWTFWELNAAQNTVRQSAREASLGVGDDFPRQVVCLSLANAADGARLLAVDVAFSTDPAGSSPLSRASGTGYVHVTLTYRASVAQVLPTPLTSRDGTFSVRATDRVEQWGPIPPSQLTHSDVAGTSC